MKLKFWENFLHLLNWNQFKFETNPIMDMRATTILIKNPRAWSWKSFHELYYNYLLHITFFYGFCLHTFFPWTTLFHTKELRISHTFIFLLLLQKTHKRPLPLVSPLSPLLELVLLVQWKVGNLSFQSMASSSFMNQWESKMIFLSYRI